MRWKDGLHENEIINDQTTPCSDLRDKPKRRKRKQLSREAKKLKLALRFEIYTVY
jgi:hypothetical protein